MYEAPSRKIWRQVPSRASTCPWVHIGRLHILAREKAPCIFSHGAPALSEKTVARLMVHVRHNFAHRFNFKYNECHVHCKLKDSGNHLEQVHTHIVPFGDYSCNVVCSRFGYRTHTQTVTEFPGLRSNMFSSINIKNRGPPGDRSRRAYSESPF